LKPRAKHSGAELQAEERKVAATTPPQDAYTTFKTELAAHVKEPEYRERVKVTLRDIIRQSGFNSLNSYTVDFKTGSSLEVIMANGEFDYTQAVDLGDTSALLAKVA